MKISWRTLQGILPDLARRGVTGQRLLYHAAGIIGKYYCEPLSMVGLCPENCGQCSVHLNHMTHELDAVHWYPHLVWRAKEERALRKDYHATHEAPETSDTGNPFSDLVNRLLR